MKTASEEPPPKPDPRGIFLCKWILNGDNLKLLFNRSYAFKTKSLLIRDFLMPE